MVMEVATRPVFDAALRDGLAEAGVEPDAVASLELEYEQNPDGFWSLDTDTLAEIDGFTRMTGFAARTVIREHYERNGSREASVSTLPELPPYLKFVDGSLEPTNYDPADMTQVYRDEGGKIWRWVHRPLTPSLQWRQVLEIEHVTVDNVQVPDDPEGLKKALAGGYDWFLKGYGSYRGWVTRGGKATFRYNLMDRARYMAVLEQQRSGPLPAGAIG